MKHDTDIATPRQAELMNLSQAQRLKDLFERKLRTLENLPEPKDYAGVDRAMKAISQADKTRRDLNTPEKAPEKPAADATNEETDMHDDTDDTADDAATLDAWVEKLELKFREMADGRRADLLARGARPEEIGPDGFLLADPPSARAKTA